MVTGTVRAPWRGECRRCGGPVSGTVEAVGARAVCARPELVEPTRTPIRWPGTSWTSSHWPATRSCSTCPWPRCARRTAWASAPGAGRTGTSPPAPARPRATPGGAALDALRGPEGGGFGLGCPSYGRSEEEDLEVEEPQPPGIQLGAEGAGPFDVPPVHVGQDPPCRLPELRLVQRPTGHRSRVVARGGARPEGEEFAALPVVVDAMGGDRAPGEIVAGAREVAERTAIKVALVGRPGEMGDIGDLPCCPGQRGHRHGRRPRQQRPPEEGLVVGAGGRGGPGRHGPWPWCRPATPGPPWRRPCSGWAGCPG